MAETKRVISIVVPHDETTVDRVNELHTTIDFELRKIGLRRKARLDDRLIPSGPGSAKPQDHAEPPADKSA